MPQIRLAPNATNDISIALLIALAMALLGLLLFAARRPTELEAGSPLLEEERNTLLDRLARLDDLYKTGTVPDAVYRLQRTELMNSLAQIYYRDRVDPPKHTTDAGVKEEGAARV